MSDTFRVNVTVEKISDVAAVTDRYGEVKTPATRKATELVCGTFSTEDETTVRARVTSMLDAAGIATPND